MRWILQLRRFLMLMMLLLSSSIPTMSQQNKMCAYANTGCTLGDYCNMYQGQCLPCWTCCNYPHLYGSCPQVCRCPIGQTCYNGDCTDGLFCDEREFRCKKCTECRVERSSCSKIDCPYGPFEGNDTRNERKNFLAFTSYNVNPNTFLDTINIQQIINWFEKNGMAGTRQYHVQKLFAKNIFISRKEFADYFANFEDTRHGVICPNISEIYNNVTVGVACPCSLGRGRNVTVRCEAGLRCSQGAAMGTDLDAFTNPLGYLLKGVCTRCSLGQYCPSGTILINDDEVDRLTCPLEHYCPSPSEKVRCENGTFCAGGNTRPLPCDYTKLLRTRVFMEDQRPLVIEKLLRNMDPYKGNTCPVGALTPSNKCPSGSYCPTSGSQVTCPKGYYCKPQSTMPTKCPVMVSCPEGTGAPTYSGGAFLFGSLISAFVLCAVYGVQLVRFFKELGPRINKYIFQRTARDDHDSDSVELHIINNPIFDREGGADTRNTLLISDVLEIPVYKRIMSWCPEMMPEDAKNPLQEFSAHIVRVKKLQITNGSARESLDKDYWLWPNTSSFEPCKVNAIMGGSGCGKSTLLELLRGRVNNGVITGMVHLSLENGEHFSLDLDALGNFEQARQLRRLRAIRGFIPQDDILYPELTVKENLVFSAKYRFGKQHDVIEKLVGTTLKHLGMEHVANRVVGSVEKRGISGGQRKRVNIGMEIVCLPSLLLMDEPTSGLDSAGTKTFLDFCKVLTNIGITIVAVIHQPRHSCFMMFDNVLFLSKYGTVYNGTPGMSLLYFNKALELDIDQNENPSDAIMDIIYNGKTIPQQRLVDYWAKMGQEWMWKALKRYPLVHEITHEDIVFTKDVLNFMSNTIEYINPRSDFVDADDVAALFNLLFIKITRKEAEEFVSYIGKRYKLQYVFLVPKHLVFAFMNEICATVFLKNTYSNVIDKIKLFYNAPSNLIIDDESRKVRTAVLSLKFAKRLLRRHQQKRKWTGDKTVLPQNMLLNIILAAMTAKALMRAKCLGRRDEGGISANLIHRGALKKYIHDLLFICHKRLLILARSPWPLQILIPMCAAFIIGMNQGTDKPLESFPSNISSAFVCLAVLSTVTHIRTFALDKVIIGREVDSKTRLEMFFVAYNFVDILWIFFLPLVFLVPYHSLTIPRIAFGNVFFAGILVCWWTSGLSYIISSLPIALHWANLVGVFISVIFGAFINGLTPSIKDSKGTFNEFLISLSYNRWIIEPLTLNEIAFYEMDRPNVVWNMMNEVGFCNIDVDYTNLERSVLQVLRMYNLDVLGMCRDYLRKPYAYIFLYGLAFRIIAFMVMWCSSNIEMRRFLAKLLA
jgi:ABC-type multidrug transport system ATPase subunit